MLYDAVIVEHMLYSHGFGYAWLNQGSTIENRSFDIYKRKLYIDLKGSHMLRLYNLISLNLSYKLYIYCISINYLRHICLLRIELLPHSV